MSIDGQCWWLQEEKASYERSKAVRSLDRGFARTREASLVSTKYSVEARCRLGSGLDSGLKHGRLWKVKPSSCKSPVYMDTEAVSFVKWIMGEVMNALIRWNKELQSTLNLHISFHFYFHSRQSIVSNTCGKSISCLTVGNCCKVGIHLNCFCGNHYLVVRQPRFPTEH